MQTQINRLATQMSHLSATQALNHDQNRKDIAEIREGQQKYTAALYEGFEKMAASLEKALTPIKTDIFNLQMWRSKTTGYVLGISAVSALISAIIFKLVEAVLPHAGLK